jgi:predicted dehydrogenase
LTTQAACGLRATAYQDSASEAAAEPFPVMLVGAGRRGLGAYVPALASIRSLRLAAIVETPERIAQLRATAPQLAATMHDSIAAGLAAVRPALAIVATPHDCHVPLTLDLLQARIPTLLEKPPARNGEEIAQLIRASSDCKTPLATALPLRHMSRYRRFMRILRSPQLAGAEVDIEADVTSFPGAGSWRQSRERAGGGVLIDLGYHYLELLVSCLGVPEVSTVQLRSGGPSRTDVEDEACVSLHFRARGLTASLTLRSGLTLARRTEMTITKNGECCFTTCEDGNLADVPDRSSGTMSAHPTATAVQLRSLRDTGFLQGRGGWYAALVKQHDVISLIDHLYAVGDHVVGLPERTLA